MLDDILKIYNDAVIDPVEKVVCKYCKKQYKKISTLASHLCEPKRRANQEKEIGVQLGLQAYLKFYEVTQGSAKNKTYESFAKSTFYMAFVKFGRYIVDIRAVNPREFIRFVISKNKKLDYWCKENVYLEYLSTYIRREAVQDAIERSVIEMQRYADKSLGSDITRYFTDGSASKICSDITNGRVSPWLVYCSPTGVNFLSTLNEEQVTIIMPWIDPPFWQSRLLGNPNDTAWVKSILTQAGL